MNKPLERPFKYLKRKQPITGKDYKKDDSFAMSIIRDFSIYSLLSPFLIWYLSSIWLGLLCLVINFMFFSYSYNIASKNNNKF